MAGGMKKDGMKEIVITSSGFLISDTVFPEFWCVYG